MRPKINDKIFGESVILLAIQLTNKYNIQNYYNNKAKEIYHEDIINNYDNINNDINKELFNKFSQIANNSKEYNNFLSNISETRLICRRPKTKRNIISLFYMKIIIIMIL